MSTLRVVSPHTHGEGRDDTLRFNLHITSETGLLRQVIVHTPGAEVELVSPEKRLDLLFEDILFIGNARKEHLLLCALYEKMVGRPDAVLQISTLLREAFTTEDARHDFIEQLCSISQENNLQAFENEFKRLSPEELHRFALTGESPLPVHANPVPNLMFTRDVAAVVGSHIIVSHPATAARARESLIMRVVLDHHSGFSKVREQTINLPPGVTFEGGDLLVPGPKVVLIGNSERTSFGGVMAIAQALFEHTDIEHVLMIDMPKERSYMHLDTIFTFVTPDECVMFPPLIHDGRVVHFTRSDAQGQFLTKPSLNLKPLLEEILERSITFIACGGNDPLNQRREQWTDGTNFFAIGPGVVVGYERNRRTFENMSKYGYRVVTAQGLLSFYEESDYKAGEKIAIKLEGTELSRGRGGPRCLTLPLARAADDEPGEAA